jgi:hypothetical protein
MTNKAALSSDESASNEIIACACLRKAKGGKGPCSLEVGEARVISCLHFGAVMFSTRTARSLGRHEN